MESTRKDKIWRNKLAKHLISLKGYRTIPKESASWIDFPTEMCKLIIKYGDLFKDKKIIMRKGNNCRCHENTIVLANKNKKLQAYFGFGLSDDGMWRPHSWLIDNKENIIETTVERIAYYGIPLPREEVIKNKLTKEEEKIRDFDKMFLSSLENIIKST